LRQQRPRQLRSTAIGAGARPAAVTSLVTDDFELKPRGATTDVGALQH
jgi:hypothetical protein